MPQSPPCGAPSPEALAPGPAGGDSLGWWPTAPSICCPPPRIRPCRLIPSPRRPPPLGPLPPACWLLRSCWWPPATGWV
jgi:hypothetical protein